MTDEPRLQSYQRHSRPDVSEGRQCGQERTLAVLLEQAFKIKEEVAAGLQSARGSVRAEALSRKLLESHILTITRIVKQLSMDTQALERQMAQQDSVTSGTTLAVQSVDRRNMAGIGDLRGRVARCDAIIAKLSADVSAGEQQMIRLQKEVAELRSAVDVRLKEMEVKLHLDLGRMEAALTECSQSRRNSMSDLHRQMKLLEDMMGGRLKEAEEQTDSLRLQTERRLDSSIQTHTQLRSLLQDKLLEAESRFTERLRALEARVEQFETQQDGADRSQADRLKRSETKLSKRMTSVEDSLHQELQLLKQDYHKGGLSLSLNDRHNVHNDTICRSLQDSVSILPQPHSRIRMSLQFSGWEVVDDGASFPGVELGASQRPQNQGVYTMYHGTSIANARLIIAGGFKQSAGGMLGSGVYVSRDMKKASHYPLFSNHSDRVVLKVRVRVGRVKRIDKDKHPLQQTWHAHGYDTAWVPPNIGLLAVPSNLEEDCVFDPKRVKVIGIAKAPNTAIEKELQQLVAKSSRGGGGATVKVCSLCKRKTQQGSSHARQQCWECGKHICILMSKHFCPAKP